MNSLDESVGDRATNVRPVDVTQRFLNPLTEI